MNINMNIKIRSIYIIRNKNSLTQIVKVSEPVNSLNYEQQFVIEIVRGGVIFLKRCKNCAKFHRCWSRRSVKYNSIKHISIETLCKGFQQKP